MPANLPPTIPPSILGLDIGRRRVGMAHYRQDQAAIVPLPTIERASKRAEKEILHLIEAHQIGLIVAGIPLASDDRETEQGSDARAFIERLSRRCSIPIVLQDEYLSSEEAKELLGIEGEPSRPLRDSGLIDAIAASIIVRRYLTARQILPSLELGALRRRAASLQRSNRR